MSVEDLPFHRSQLILIFRATLAFKKLHPVQTHVNYEFGELKALKNALSYRPLEIAKLIVL